MDPIQHSTLQGRKDDRGRSKHVPHQGPKRHYFKREDILFEKTNCKSQSLRTKFQLTIPVTIKAASFDARDAMLVKRGADQENGSKNKGK
jgi:hypothetical protein